MTEEKPEPKVDALEESARAAFAQVAAKEAEAPEPVEPAQEQAEPKDDLPRAPDGKFAKKDSEPKPVEEPSGLDKAEKDARTDKPEPVEVAPSVTPPPGFSITTKSQWDAIAKQFPSLVADIAKREAEVDSGFKQYAGLKPYAERASKSGQTLSGVMERFAGMEDLLRRDPEQGFAFVGQNLGMSQHEFGQLCLKMAARFGAAPQSPVPTFEEPQQFDPNAINRLVQAEIDRRIGPLEQNFNQMTVAQRLAQERTVSSVVDKFRSDPAHRYFDNVEDSIAQIFESGMVERTGDYAADLAKAYELACWQNPEIRPLLIKEQTEKAQAEQRQREQAVAAKARAASKSLAGSPTPASGGNSAMSLDDAARTAFRQHAMQ